MIRTDTAASSGEAEVAEADATDATLTGAELTAVWTPMLVGDPPPTLRSVKLAELLLGILDGFARRAFVHWV